MEDFISQINLSRALGVPRVFVESMACRDEVIYISAVYRQGRVFCGFDHSFKALFQISEDILAGFGNWDYRAMTVSPEGNMLLSGRNNRSAGGMSVFSINPSGEVTHLRDLPGIQHASEMAEHQGSLFFHSPLYDTPLVRFDPGFDTPRPMGVFPVDRIKVADRKALLHHGGDVIWLVYETVPGGVSCLDCHGREMFYHVLNAEDKGIDGMTAVIDSDLNSDTGELLVMTAGDGGKPLILRAVECNGKMTEKMRFHRDLRRFCTGAGGRLFWSITRFNVIYMFIHLDIYSCTLTTLESGRLEGVLQ